MATVLHFEDLKVWQKARVLCQQIFDLTTSGKFARDFALIDQINRSSGSIMDNIAEGYGRLGNREFINFLTYSNASALECKSQVYRAFDKNYISTEKQEELFGMLDEIIKMIHGLISYLGKTNKRGVKFKSGKTSL